MNHDPHGSVSLPSSRKVDSMRLLLGVATVAALGLSNSAVAADKDISVVPASTSNSTVPVVQVAQSRPMLQPVQAGQGGFFGRLMEVERRKNAWLRRTFLQ